jgi:hypothetical protein
MTTQTDNIRELSAVLIKLDNISLTHNVEMRPECARYWADQQFKKSCDVGPATGFGLSAWQTGRLIRLIDDTMPRMDFGLNNPANGRVAHTYKIGREYSRVIYVNLPKLYNTTADWKQTEKEIRILAKHYQADEIDVEQTPVSFEARLWWD